MELQDNTSNKKIEETPDLIQKGLKIVKTYSDYGFFGDYYVIGCKKSEFYYVALNYIESFCLNKAFLFQSIFRKFPGVQSVLMAESFSRYIKEFRRPVNQARQEHLDALNRKKNYI